ncbi:MAG: hypothetical protein ACRBG0_09170 [Lewinella sp.]|jgi:uncharacterized membrane protein (DUF106 family)|uniref:hypothetical protein n=1 Tax=Lewinella sp. TaxID=2004506 RepID=UPI003D6BB0FD
MKEEDFKKEIGKEFEKENKKDDFYFILFSSVGMIVFVLIAALLFPESIHSDRFLVVVLLCGFLVGAYSYIKWFLSVRTVKKMKKVMGEIAKKQKKKKRRKRIR